MAKNYTDVCNKIITPKSIVMAENIKITVEAVVNAPLEKVWTCWTSPEHIVQWNNASDDWHTPHAENDLRVDGSFSSRMEAKDGSFGFDFGGRYTAVREHEYIEYVLGDGRVVSISFAPVTGGVQVTEVFDAESVNPVELQQTGWQAILNNFKRHTESVS